jgi:hypothetical protein
MDKKLYDKVVTPSGFTRKIKIDLKSLKLTETRVKSSPCNLHLTKDGNYDLQNKRLKNVAEPNDNNDAVSKIYADKIENQFDRKVDEIEAKFDTKSNELKNFDTWIKYNFNNLNKLAKKHNADFDKSSMELSKIQEDFRNLKDSHDSSVSSTYTAFDSTLKEKLKPIHKSTTELSKILSDFRDKIQEVSVSIQANTNRIVNGHKEWNQHKPKVMNDLDMNGFQITNLKPAEYGPDIVTLSLQQSAINALRNEMMTVKTINIAPIEYSPEYFNVNLELIYRPLIPNLYTLKGYVTILRSFVPDKIPFALLPSNLKPSTNMIIPIFYFFNEMYLKEGSSENKAMIEQLMNKPYSFIHLEIDGNFYLNPYSLSSHSCYYVNQTFSL